MKVECSASGWAASTKLLPGVRIECDQPMLAVAIPASLLALPFSMTPGRTAEPAGESAATDLAGSLRQVLRPWIRGGMPSQQIAAEMLGTNPRSMCRWLAEEGTSWREITNELKFHGATARLQEGRLRVREIAEELGYSDTTHFTRFFETRAGISPSQYRLELERARELTRSASH